MTTVNITMTTVNITTVIITPENQQQSLRTSGT